MKKIGKESEKIVLFRYIKRRDDTDVICIFVDKLPDL